MSRDIYEPQSTGTLTAEDLADLQSPEHVRISPSGSHVIWSLTPRSKSAENTLSSIWIADFGKAVSARRLTSGDFNDRDAEWSPDGRSIAFISDRGGAGKVYAIYLLSTEGGEPCPMTDPEKEASIESFGWSADGQFIAFISPEEKTEERRLKDELKDDVKLFGEEWRYNRLRLMQLETREVEVMFAEEAHVSNFAWSPDSREIALMTVQTPEIGSGLVLGSRLVTISLANKTQTTVTHFPGAFLGRPVWYDDHILFQACVVPDTISSAEALYSVALRQSAECKLFRHGIEDSLQDLRRSAYNEGITVQIQSGLDDEIATINGKTLHKMEQRIISYDATKLGEDDFRLALITSTFSIPPEVFSKSREGELVRLSNHGATVLSCLPEIDYRTIQCSSFDGKVSLDAVWAAPASALGCSGAALASMIYIHGGPYSRITNSFYDYGIQWGPWILSRGYGLLSINYRGGSGRGQRFAEYAKGGVGTVEYDDLLAMIEEAIRLGLVDKEKLIVAGWSQGGFLSYLSCVRNGNVRLPNGGRRTWKYKGAICGAGVTDCECIHCPLARTRT